MSVSTTIAISAATSANLAAQQAAAAAARAECIAYVPNYKHAGATLEQIQYYAYCAEKLYPKHEEMPHDQVVLAKLALILILGGGVFGAYKMFMEPFGGDVLDRVLLGFIAGAVYVLIGLLLAAMVFFSISFLFS